MQTRGERFINWLHRLGKGIAALPGKIGRGVANAFRAVGHGFRQLGQDIATGDGWVRASLLVCGAGYFGRKQIVKGILVTLLQAAVMYVIPVFFWPYLCKFGTLGTVAYVSTFNLDTGLPETNNYDHSFKILLYSVIGILLICTAVYLYFRNIRKVRALQAIAEEGKHVATFRDDLRDLSDRRFHVTLLSLPVLGVIVFTIIPLIVMVLTAFTNYDLKHVVPKNLFTWVGFDNFKSLFSTAENSTSYAFGYSFTRITAWTLIWAFLATFTNYYAGILLAMFINNKRTRLKKMWRTCFIVTMAVPQFVSLLLIRNFFANTGIVNTLCTQWGVTQALKDIGILAPSYSYIPFLTDPSWAKVMIILINMWVGVPYLMLMCTGILMNIPTDLLESAQIDGANAFQRFRKIIMPYIRFVTGPYLISSVVGNINNFNIIYLLTNDIYTNSDQIMANANAREVDLLVTWLYRLTQEKYNYKMASTIGIMIFLISAFFTLLAFRSMTKGDKEETFQ